jgi:vitamin B12 transporter
LFLNFFRALLLIFGILNSLLLSAQTGSTPQEIVVTANRRAQTVDDSLASVSVITRQEIEKSNASSLYEVLRGIPGIEVVNSGGMGKTTSIFMRGSESDHVLVLVDGVKIGSATLGTIPFEYLPLSQIERIEIVSGPRSSLYGSEAIGGIIQIFTRRGQGNKPQLNASAGVGSENTYQLTGGFLGSTQHNWYSISANHLRTDGFNSCQDNASAGCFAIEPDEDGYDNTAINAHFGHRLSDNGEIEALIWRMQGTTQYDSSFDNEADFVQQVMALKTNYAINDQWLLNLNVGHSSDESDHFGNQATTSFFDTQRTSASLLSHWFLPNERIFALGYDYQQDEVESSTDYTATSRNNHAIFSEYQMKLGRADLTVGLRRDDNEQFRDYTTGNLALGYALPSNMRLFFSYGTAFKAPSFNELYYPGFGNPQLAPEESKSFEIGFKGHQKHSRWTLSLYHSQIEQLIATDFNPTTGDYFAANLNKGKITGAESSFYWQQNRWDFNFQLSWLKPEDEATGHLLPRRPEGTVKIEIGEQRGPARLSFGFLAQSHRYDDAANTQRLGGYGIFNVNGEYNFDKNWMLRFRLENLLDKDYTTAAFYNTPGRVWFVSLHYRD